METKKILYKSSLYPWIPSLFTLLLPKTFQIHICISGVGQLEKHVFLYLLQEKKERKKSLTIFLFLLGCINSFLMLPFFCKTTLGVKHTYSVYWDSQKNKSISKGEGKKIKGSIPVTLLTLQRPKYNRKG